jgi:tRNA(fMet)-specific endonuclease VapC
MFMLDTNSCIDFTLGRSDALRERIRRSYRRGLAISTITLGELRVGPKHPGADPEDERRLDVFIGTLTVHPFDERAAEEYGRVARSVGVKRMSFDRLIAAHARALDLTLVTRNESDFADVPSLRIVNWTQ